MGADAILWFFFLKSLYKLRIFRSILWGIPTYLVTKMVAGYKLHSNHMITKMHLKDNGT